MKKGRGAYQAAAERAHPLNIHAPILVIRKQVAPKYFPNPDHFYAALYVLDNRCRSLAISYRLGIALYPPRTCRTLP